MRQTISIRNRWGKSNEDFLLHSDHYGGVVLGDLQNKPWDGQGSLALFYTSTAWNCKRIDWLAFVMSCSLLHEAKSTTVRGNSISSSWTKKKKMCKAICESHSK